MTAARARDELAAARVLAVAGLTAQALHVAFRAALEAAEATLLVLGRVPPEDQGSLVAQFVAKVVGERGLDAEAGGRLRLLLNRSRLAEVATPPPAEAEAAIEDARVVIASVTEWLAVSARVARERRTAPAAPS